MDAIWKFELAISGEQQVVMPAGALILGVQMQHGKPHLWARVNPQAEGVKRRIITHGTGHPVPKTTGSYIGSYHLESRLAFHVFEAAAPNSV